MGLAGNPMKVTVRVGINEFSRRSQKMKGRSLAFKLITGGILAVLIPLVVVGLFAVDKASNSLEGLAKEQAMNIAHDLATMTRLVLQEEIKLVQELAAGYQLRSAQRASAASEGKDGGWIESLSEKLGRSLGNLGKDYEAIVVTDGSGTVIADSNQGKLKGISIRDRDYFLAAEKGEANVGTVVKSKDSGLPVIPVSAPMYDEDGTFRGTVTAVLNIGFLTKNITSVKVGETGYPFMVDKTGLTIAHPNRQHILKTNLAKQKGMETIMGNMLAQENGVDSYVFEGINKIAGYAPVGLKGWSIGVTQPTDEFKGAAYAIRNVVFLVGGGFLLLTVLAVFFFARSITRPIMRAAESLNDGSDQVAAASTQVSASSQSLAEGASESAASLEETSSSLEEMSAMTQQNAGHANEADSLMKETNQVVTHADGSMARLTQSMEEISAASEETQKIIKTIDEIAFQTNLLALNAAVEAARAGEAGAGFAVVADEVRNLALRAADAAKNTAELIEDTVKKINDGTEVVSGTGAAFGETVTRVRKVGDLVNEIAAASTEQAKGVEQINQAIVEMDKVTQQNAANAEESAAASEEMNAQAEQMRSVVRELVGVISGNQNRNGSGKAAFNAHYESAPPLMESGRKRGRKARRELEETTQMGFETPHPLTVMN